MDEMGHEIVWSALQRRRSDTAVAIAKPLQDTSTHRGALVYPEAYMCSCSMRIKSRLTANRYKISVYWLYLSSIRDKNGFWRDYIHSVNIACLRSRANCSLSSERYIGFLYRFYKQNTQKSQYACASCKTLGKYRLVSVRNERIHSTSKLA
jgi:hypothetical protein